MEVGGRLGGGWIRGKLGFLIREGVEGNGAVGEGACVREMLARGETAVAVHKVEVVVEVVVRRFQCQEPRKRRGKSYEGGRSFGGLGVWSVYRSIWSFHALLRTCVY